MDPVTVFLNSINATPMGAAKGAIAMIIAIVAIQIGVRILAIIGEKNSNRS